MKKIKNLKLKEYLIELLIIIVSFITFLIFFVKFEWDAVITATAIIGAGELIRNHIREGRKE